MNRCFWGLTVVALGVVLFAAGARELPAAPKGVTVQSWEPVIGKLMKVDVTHKALWVKATQGIHRVWIANGIDVLAHRARKSVSDLTTLRQYQGRTVRVSPEKGGAILLSVQ